jgi:GntR family transcriptional repressor for pyruvate dehydrogenase complex
MDFPFQKVERPVTLSQEVFESIRDAIMQRKIEPGQKLPTEQQLCEIFSVSRTAVREALQVLSAKGLIAIRRRSGIFVSDFPSNEAISAATTYLQLHFSDSIILHVFEVREMIEPQLCKLAAIRKTEEDLRSLETILANVKDESSDASFHRAIAVASKNPVALMALEPLLAVTPQVQEFMASHIENYENSSPAYHARIFGAIRDGNEAMAAEEMLEHIQIDAVQLEDAILKLSGKSAILK